jgi:hypothetical protein
MRDIFSLFSSVISSRHVARPVREVRGPSPIGTKSRGPNQQVRATGCLAAVNAPLLATKHAPRATALLSSQYSASRRWENPRGATRRQDARACLHYSLSISVVKNYFEPSDGGAAPCVLEFQLPGGASGNSRGSISAALKAIKNQSVQGLPRTPGVPPGIGARRWEENFFLLVSPTRLVLPAKYVLLTCASGYIVAPWGGQEIPAIPER